MAQKQNNKKALVCTFGKCKELQTGEGEFCKKHFPIKISKMKHYFVNFEVDEGVPDYEFVIKAESLSKAREKANIIIKQDYPEAYEKDNFKCNKITAEQLLDLLTIN